MNPASERTIGNLVQLAIDQPAPVFFFATSPWRGEQAPYVGQSHAEAATESNQHEAIDRIRAIAAFAAHPIRFWQDAGVFVVPNCGGLKAGCGRDGPNAQCGFRTHI